MIDLILAVFGGLVDGFLGKVNFSGVDGDLSGSPRHLRLRHSPSIEVGPAHTLTRLIRY